MLLALTEAQIPEIHHFGINLMDEKLTEEDEIDLIHLKSKITKTKRKKGWYSNRIFFSTGKLLGEIRKVMIQV